MSNDYPTDEEWNAPIATSQDPGEHEIINMGQAMPLTPGGPPQESTDSDLSTGVYAGRSNTVTTNIDGTPIAVSEGREDVVIVDALLAASLPSGESRTRAFRMRNRMRELDQADMDRHYGPARVQPKPFGALPEYNEPES